MSMFFSVLSCSALCLHSPCRQSPSAMPLLFMCKTAGTSASLCSVPHFPRLSLSNTNDSWEYHLAVSVCATISHKQPLFFIRQTPPFAGLVVTGGSAVMVGDNFTVTGQFPANFILHLTDNVLTTVYTVAFHTSCSQVDPHSPPPPPPTTTTRRMHARIIASTANTQRVAYDNPRPPYC
jgi:hypothetical protein